MNTENICRSPLGILASQILVQQLNIYVMIEIGQRCAHGDTALGEFDDVNHPFPSPSPLKILPYVCWTFPPNIGDWTTSDNPY
jgi:hypothetical protein